MKTFVAKKNKNLLKVSNQTIRKHDFVQEKYLAEPLSRLPLARIIKMNKTESEPNRSSWFTLAKRLDLFVKTNNINLRFIIYYLLTDIESFTFTLLTCLEQPNTNWDDVG